MKVQLLSCHSVADGLMLKLAGPTEKWGSGELGGKLQRK
jgi:hypothetical protein